MSAVLNLVALAPLPLEESITTTPSVDVFYRLRRPSYGTALRITE